MADKTELKDIDALLIATLERVETHTIEGFMLDVYEKYPEIFIDKGEGLPICTNFIESHFPIAAEADTFILKVWFVEEHVEGDDDGSCGCVGLAIENNIDVCWSSAGIYVGLVFSQLAETLKDKLSLTEDWQKFFIKVIPVS